MTSSRSAVLIHPNSKLTASDRRWIMTDERRVENVIDITDTLWQLNKYKVIGKIETASECKVPEDCYKLMEWCFRYGAMYMERAIGGRK